MRITRFRSFAVLGALALTLTACGGSDKSVDAADDADKVDTTDDDTGTTEGDEGDLSPFAREFAEGFSSSAGFDLPDGEIQCLADAVLDEFSFKELTSFQSEADVTADPAIVARLGSLFDDCVSTETMVSLFVDQGVPLAAAECVAEEVTFSRLIDAGLNPDSAETEALGQLMVDCM